MIDKSLQDRLRGDLTTLHDILEDVAEVDTDAKNALQLVATDIQSILEQESADQNWFHIRQRWRDAVLHFESQHPRLTQILDQITGVLANAGI